MTDYSAFSQALVNKGVSVFHCAVSHTGKYVRLVTDDTKETQKVLMETVREVAKANDWKFDFINKSTSHINKLTLQGQTYNEVRNLLLPFVQI